MVALGLGTAGAGPAGTPRPPAGTTLDYDREVHGHGDRFVPAGRPTPAAPALQPRRTSVLSGGRPGGGRGSAARRCPPAAGCWSPSRWPGCAAVLAGLLVPLATGVTAVLCRHLDPSRLPARIDQEGLVAAAGTPTRRAVPAWVPGAVRLTSG